MGHSGSVFVGRDGELALLLSGLDDVRAGRARFFALVGDAGIGKTRTVEQFLARAGVPDERVLWGRCPEHHGLPALWPWTQAIGRYVERCEADALARVLGRTATDLGALVPAIGERLGRVDPPAPADPTQARFRVFDGVATFLRRTAESEPIVVVLDDLHWADEGSILLLTFLAPELRRSRVLLLATYRDREMQRLPRLLADVVRVSERVPLRGLRVEEVADFVREHTDAVPRNALVAELHRVSRGNPFFLTELVRMLQASGRLEHEDGELGPGLPDEVRQVIHRNLAPLAAADRELLTTAAVIGYEFDVARLRAVSGLDPENLLERLQQAAETGVLDEIPGASGRFRFVHMLVRDAAYADLPALERARVHQRVGLALETLYEGARDVPCAELARHFVHAAVLGDATKALTYSTRAGEQALARLAYEEAAGHFEVALKVARLGRPDEARDLALRMLLGQAQSYAGDHPHARATFERAAERARALGDVQTFAQAALGFGFATPGIGAVYPTLVALLEEALRVLGEGDSPLRAAVLGSLASALYFSRDEARRDALSDEAVAMARRVGDPRTLARTLVQRHHVLWGPAPVSDRLALCAEIIPLATACGDRRVALHGRLWRIIDLLEAGDLEALDLELETFARESAHARIPLYRWFAGVASAMRALLGGRLADSERLAADAATLWHEGPLSLAAQTHALQRFMVAMEADRLGELTDLFAAFARDYPSIVGWPSGLALIHARNGRADEARALLHAFTGPTLAGLPRDAIVLSALVTFAQVAHALQDAAAAAALHAALVPYADRHVVVGFGAGTWGACTRYLGLLAATLGRLDEAAGRLENALAANTRLGARPLVAATQCDYAAVLLQRHERARAHVLLEDARRTAEELGLVALLAQIAAVSGAAAPARPRATTGVFRREGAHWTVGYDGLIVRMRHASGNAYLAMLLQRPGQEVHVLDLTVARSPETGDTASTAEAGVRRHASSDAGDVIDAQARAAYKRRLSEAREELEEARRFNDLGRIDQLEAEIETVTHELTRAVGLGGRPRKAGSAAERARINVSRAIATVLKRITAEHPRLGEHLAARVHTGTFCSYTPDELSAVEWTL
jgi:tetratricopeptide (TPR) repeat protein